MSAAFDAFCAEVREANTMHTPEDIEVILDGVRNVYEGMLVKNYPDQAAVQSARDFYVEYVSLSKAKTIWDGQHR